MAGGVTKVTKYETFLNEKLRPDLKACLEDRDKIYSEIAEFSSLKKSIEALESADLPAEQSLKTKVDLGQNFYVKARVKNHKKVFVDIGFGMFLEMSYAEALEFIEKKNDILDKEPFVECQDCGRKLHQICVLHNESIWRSG